MRYLVVLGCLENSVQHIMGGAADFEIAGRNAKEAILSGFKFWNSEKSEMVVATRAFIYELAAEAIANVEIKAVEKEVLA